MSRWFLVVAGLFIVFTPYVARSEEEISPAVRDAFAEISEELSTCYGYYLIGGQCAANAHADDVVKANQKLEAYVLDLVGKTGNKAGISLPAMQAFLRLSMQSMKKDIGNSCANLPILIEKHGQICKELLEGAEKRFSDLLSDNPKHR